MPELLEAAKDTGTELYYCELDKYRNTYIYDRELNAPVQTKPAGEGYEELLTWLDGYTHDYIIKDPAGNEIPVGEQRISVPTLIRWNMCRTLLIPIAAMTDGTRAYKIKSIARYVNIWKERSQRNNKSSKKACKKC